MSGRLDLGGAVVAVLGWAGATERQLRGVVGWYRARGGEPLVVLPAVFRNMALPFGWAREGAQLAARLTDRPGAPRIVVHSFSNAGFWTYAAALRALERSAEGRAARDRIDAAIFDSAPGFPAELEPRFTARYSAMAMMPMLLRSLGRPPALAHPLLDPPARAFMRLWYHVSPRQVREAQESLRVVRDTGAWPLLFLYSSRDPLVPHAHVEAFTASIARREVRARRWEDTEHVQHMIAHRTEYLGEVDALLCRRTGTGGTSAE